MSKQKVAFEIINDLLNNDCISEGIRPTRAQEIVASTLARCLSWGAPMHYQDPHHGDALCHTIGSTALTENEHNVTCKRCLETLNVSGRDRWR